jgi:hypothetical protein
MKKKDVKNRANFPFKIKTNFMLVENELLTDMIDNLVIWSDFLRGKVM